MQHVNASSVTQNIYHWLHDHEAILYSSQTQVKICWCLNVIIWKLHIKCSMVHLTALWNTSSHYHWNFFFNKRCYFYHMNIFLKTIEHFRNCNAFKVLNILVNEWSKATVILLLKLSLIESKINSFIKF